MLRTSFIKTSALGLAVASTSLFAEATYTPNKYQQNDWFAEFGGNTAMYVNPAGISETDQLEFSAAFFSTISGEASQEYVSLTYPIDYKHTLGFSLFENGASIEGGESYGEIAAQFGYAYRLFHLLSLGVNLDVLYINQFDELKQLTVGADVGLSWNPLASSKYGYLLIGVAVQNLLAPAVSEADGDGSFKFVLMGAADAYKIPTNLNVSFFYRGFNRLLEMKAEFSLIDIIHDSDEGGKGANLEMSFTLTYYLSSHLGVRARFTKEGYPVIGATVNVKDVSIFRYLALDLEMSHDDLWAKKNRGFVWAVKLTSRFGDTREEKIGEERYRRLKIEPENDYRAAMRLYLNRQFLEAAYAFGKVQTKYPAFHLVDQAAFYKAKSFENLRMHKAAKSVYEDAIKRYPQSDQRAKYHFQLMNIDYKEGKYTEAMTKYQNIAQKFGESDVKADADYVAGQIKFEQGLYHRNASTCSPPSSRVTQTTSTLAIPWVLLTAVWVSSMKLKTASVTLRNSRFPTSLNATFRTLQELSSATSSSLVKSRTSQLLLRCMARSRRNLRCSMKLCSVLHGPSSRSTSRMKLSSRPSGSFLTFRNPSSCLKLTS